MIIEKSIIILIFSCSTQFSYKFNANSNSFQLTRNQHTCTMRANYRVNFHRKISCGTIAPIAFFFFFAERDMFRQLHDSDHVHRGIREITLIAKYPCLLLERSIDDVDIERYNFCFRAWRTYHPITSVLSRESEYKFRLLCQTCREKVPDSRRAHKLSLCASKESDEKVRFLSATERCSFLYRFS